MQSIKRSCLRWVLFYVITALLLSALVWIRFPRPQFALAAGFGAGIFVWLSIAYFRGMRDRRAEARLIRRGMHEGRPNDGERIAVPGVISTAFETLEAPISRRSCLAYEYKALPGANQQYAAYEGFALVPLSIEGPRGSIRLHAAPELAFPEEVLIRIEQYDNLREYIARTTFLDHGGLNLGRELDHVKSVFADDDGRIRYDIRRDSPADVTAMRLTEKILAQGERAVAIGRYSAARNALVPDEKALMHPVKIRKGEPEHLARTGKRDLVDMMMGCGCFLPVLLAALIGLAAVPLDAIEQMFPDKNASWTEIRVEQWVQRTLRPKLAWLLPPEEGELAIQLQPGQARGKLTIDLLTIPLEKAYAKRTNGGVEVWLTKDGTVFGVLARVRPDGTIESVMIPEFGFISGADVESRNLSMDGETISGRIQFLSPEKSARFRAEFRAKIQDGVS